MNKDSKMNSKLKAAENQNLTLLPRKLSAKKARLGKKRLKDYGKVLLAKQLLRALYNNPREKIFKKYFEQKSQAAVESQVLGKLNSRLEVVLTAMGGAISNGHARQLINHGKVSVNGHIVKERGFLLKDGDIVSSTVGFNSSLDGMEVFRNSTSESELNIGIGQKRKFQAKAENKQRVASLKPAKIPKYLHLNSPVFANLLVNKELNYGIYYTKKDSLNQSLRTPSVDTLQQSWTQPKVAFERNQPKGELENTKNLNQHRFSGVRFKNGRVPQVSSILRSLSEQVGLGWKNTNVSAVKSLLLELKTTQEPEIKEAICTLLYKLTSAYYSRVS
jgi:ribosomal protein S4